MNPNPRMLITGITGQDGPYLAEAAMKRGYTVYGMVRGQDNPKAKLRRGDYQLVQGDLTDHRCVQSLVRTINPNVIVNLGAVTFVPFSWEQPEVTMRVNVEGLHNLLNAALQLDALDAFIQASTSEMFGNVSGLLDENSKMEPVSPYGISKLAAHHLCLNYREAYNANIISAIMFNHESPYRGEQFVTRKISMAAARIRRQLDEGNPAPALLHLGNLEARRDWGWSPDYMAAILEMASQPSHGFGSYVLATNHTASVASFAEEAFNTVKLNYKDWIVSDGQHVRVNELHSLRGNPQRAAEVLNWTATYRWRDIARLMTRADLARLERREE